MVRKVQDRMLRTIVYIDDLQFSCTPGRGIVDAYFKEVARKILS